MKKTTCLLLAALLIFGVAGCKRTKVDDNQSDADSSVSGDFSSNVDSTESTDSDAWISVGGDESSGEEENNQGGGGNTQSGGGNSQGNGGNSSVVISGGQSADSLFAKIPKNFSGKTIKVMTWWKISASEEAKAKLFTQKTGIKIKFDTVALEDYYSKLAAKISASNAPDVAALNSEYFPIYITKKLFQPAKSVGFELNDPAYDMEVMNNFKWKNTHYGVTVKACSMNNFLLTYWNKTMFRQKNMTETPETLWKKGKWNWQTCLELAQKMTDTKKDIYGLAYMYHWYWTASENQDFIKITDHGISSNFGNNKIYSSWKWAWDLKNTYKVTRNGAPTAAEFINGKNAMFIYEAFLMQSQSDLNTMKDEWGVVPMPSPVGASGYVAPGVSHLWGVPVKSKQPAAGAWYIRYWLDPSYDLASYPAYKKKECYDIMEWMSSQKKRIWLSDGVLAYGGEYDYRKLQHDLSYATPSELQAKLDSWASIYEANIKDIMKEYNS